MKYLIWLLVVILIVLHQDVWFWEDSTLVFGILPIGLFYHACLSLAAGVVWWMAVTWAWPEDLEEATWAAVESHEPAASQGGASSAANPEAAR